MHSITSLMADLQARALISQHTPELEAHLAGGSRSVYCGFDPTADSLHVGSLVPLLALRRFQLAGHRPIALVGGATGLVGDPSFKAQERSLNPGDLVSSWTESIRSQLERFLDFEGSNCALVVNNLDWFASIGFLEFLRTVGKHFAVNTMINKESVRQRIDREGTGISYAEFSYMLMQAYDFYKLNHGYGCSVQLGGSDQWGNITGGVDLCRRLGGAHVHALTLPLITKSDGSKFGKTESGTVWLDPARTSPYSFYQFWLSVADADVCRFLGYFTFLSPEAIDGLRPTSEGSPGRPEAQKVLARETTLLVHGAGGLAAAERITAALFDGDHASLTETDFGQLAQDGLPTTRLAPEDLQKPLTTLLVEVGLASTGKQVKDALSRSALMLNDRPCGLDDNLRTAQCFQSGRASCGRFFLARLGKKRFHLFMLA